MEEERTFRDVATEVSIELLEKSREMEAGSDKHSKVIEDAVKLNKACNENYRAEYDMYHEELKIENDKKRIEEESEHRRLQIDLEKLKHERVKADSMLMSGTAIGLTLFACYWELTGGHLIPSKAFQVGSSILKVIK